MVYGKTPFQEVPVIKKPYVITDPNYQIFYDETMDDAANDAIKQCLRRVPEERAPIVGKNGLLNEHRFLNSCRRSS